jgi:hypothetical protein
MLFLPDATKGYKLPATPVIYTVGPCNWHGGSANEDDELLASGYRRPLDVACQHYTASLRIIGKPCPYDHTIHTFRTGNVRGSLVQELIEASYTVERSWRSHALPS